MLALVLASSALAHPGHLGEHAMPELVWHRTEIVLEPRSIRVTYTSDVPTSRMSDVAGLAARLSAGVSLSWDGAPLDAHRALATVDAEGVHRVRVDLRADTPASGVLLVRNTNFESDSGGWAALYVHVSGALVVTDTNLARVAAGAAFHNRDGVAGEDDAVARAARLEVRPASWLERKDGSFRLADRLDGTRAAAGWAAWLAPSAR